MVGIDRKTYHYDAVLKSQDSMIKNLLRELSELHPRYGFKKLFGLIRQQGYLMNHKRVYRVYCELKLNLKGKIKKRLPPRVAIKLNQPAVKNRCWSLDFMSDALSENSTLTHLNFANSKLNTWDLYALKRSMNNNSTLTLIQLWENSIDMLTAAMILG